MTGPERPEDVYRPPAAPPPPVEPHGDHGDEVEESQEVSRVRRRSRVVVITVIAASATLLLGLTVAIVMLTAGLLSAIGDRGGDADTEKPAVVEQEPEEPEEPQPVRAGECGELCGALESEIGVDAGAWAAEAGWSDAEPEVGATAAATAVFTSDLGTGTLTVLQFDTDEQAAQAVIDLGARIGEPVFETTVFDDGSGTRYDYDGALTSRVLWHLDAQSAPHEVGRLYLIEAPTNAAADFSEQAAYQLYLALPL